MASCDVEYVVQTVSILPPTPLSTLRTRKRLPCDPYIWRGLEIHAGGRHLDFGFAMADGYVQRMWNQLNNIKANLKRDGKGDKDGPVCWSCALSRQYLTMSRRTLQSRSGLRARQVNKERSNCYSMKLIFRSMPTPCLPLIQRQPDRPNTLLRVWMPGLPLTTQPRVTPTIKSK